MRWKSARDMPMPTRCKPTTSAGGEDVRRQKSGNEGTLDRSDDDQRLPQPAPSEEELEMTKITTGPNDAPKDATNVHAGNDPSGSSTDDETARPRANTPVAFLLSATCLGK